MSQSIYQKQITTLFMSQQMQQAITILQLSHEELLQYISDLTLENPVINLENNNYSKRTEVDILNPIDYLDFSEVTLSDYLIDQLNEVDIHGFNRNYLLYIIHSLDENGYLPMSNQELAEELLVNENEVNKLIHFIQSLEPAGVGSHNLKECLLLQIHQLPADNYLLDDIEQILTDYFKEFAEKKWQIIADKMKINVERIRNIHALVKTLKPKPGSQFQRQSTEYITADVEVIVENNNLTVKLKNDILKDLNINQEYLDILKNQDDQTLKYLKNKLEELNWLRRNVIVRNETLLKVCEAIFQIQKDFFVGGESKLKPLTLNMIATEVEVSEATVSRVSRNKYIDTGNGIFELKYFFRRKINTDEDTNISATLVKEKIKAIIQGEDKAKPFSDQKIKIILENNSDIKVSRRVIAKYREEMNILSSVNRKIIS